MFAPVSALHDDEHRPYYSSLGRFSRERQALLSFLPDPRISSHPVKSRRRDAWSRRFLALRRKSPRCMRTARTNRTRSIRDRRLTNGTDECPSFLFSGRQRDFSWATNSATFSTPFFANPMSNTHSSAIFASLGILEYHHVVHSMAFTCVRSAVRNLSYSSRYGRRTTARIPKN